MILSAEELAKLAAYLEQDAADDALRIERLERHPGGYLLAQKIMAGVIATQMVAAKLRWKIAGGGAPGNGRERDLGAGA